VKCYALHLFPSDTSFVSPPDSGEAHTQNTSPGPKYLPCQASIALEDLREKLLMDKCTVISPGDVSVCDLSKM